MHEGVSIGSGVSLIAIGEGITLTTGVADSEDLKGRMAFCSVAGPNIKAKNTAQIPTVRQTRMATNRPYFFTAYPQIGSATIFLTRLREVVNRI